MSAVARDFVPNVYHGMSNEDYHSGPGISNSGLGDILQSPLHYYARHLDPNRPPEPEKAGQLEGNLAHCAVLEPNEFDKRYAVTPADAPRKPTSIQRNAKKPSPETVKAIEWWDNWNAKTGGMITVTAEQYETALRQRDAVWALPDVAEALSKGHAEVSAYWRDKDTDALCRVRPDFVHDAGRSGVVLLDLKTYSDASPNEFTRQVARKAYHRQAAYYSDGYALASGRPVLAFIFVAVEMPWPNAASAVMLDDAGLSAGRAMYRRALNLYAECLANNTWPGYSDAIELVSLPAYMTGEW